MALCPKCERGSLKQVRMEHTVKTRYQNKTFENLPMVECTICDFIGIPKRGEEAIDALKLTIKQEMERIALQEKKELQKKKKTGFFAGLKSIIS